MQIDTDLRHSSWRFLICIYNTMDLKDNKQEAAKNEFVRSVAERKYEFGFTTDVHTEIIEKGLSEDVVRLISAKKNEPEWMLEFRLKAYRHWLTMKQPDWAHVKLPEIDYQDISYYADPMAGKPEKKAEDIDPELIELSTSWAYRLRKGWR